MFDPYFPQSPFIILWSINLFLIYNVHLYFMITKVLLIHNFHLCSWSFHTKASFDPLFALCLHDHQSFNKTLVIQNSNFIFIIIKTLLIQSFNISQSSCNFCLCIAHVSFVEYKLTYLFNNVQDHKNAHSKMEWKKNKIKLSKENFNHYTQIDHSCQKLEKIKMEWKRSKIKLIKKNFKISNYDILGAGMFWKPKETRKLVKIRENLLKFASKNVLIRC